MSIDIKETTLMTPSRIVQNLVSAGLNRTQIGMIREAFDDIEAARLNGFSYKKFEAELIINGIPLKNGSLKNIIRRIRLERSKPTKSEIGKGANPPVAAQRATPKQVVEAKVFTRNTNRDPKVIF